MASHPPNTCCTIGVKHEGSIKGQMISIGSISTYITHTSDKSTKNAILILTDVIGHDSINVQLIADQFAANGYFTVVPDLFSGDPVPLNRPGDFDVMAWLQGANGPKKTPDVVDPIVTGVVKSLRNDFKVQKLGAVGYCFGGKYVARFLGPVGSSNNAMVDAGYTAHPSFVDEEELKGIRGPLSIAAAETDSIFPEEKRHASERILKELAQGSQSIPYQINLFSHVSHGFATRADIKQPSQKFAKEAAFMQAVQWFNFHMLGGDMN